MEGHLHLKYLDPLLEKQWSDQQIESLLIDLQKKLPFFETPMMSLLIQNYGKNPFLILITCLLSLRSRDVVTWPIAVALFEQIKTAQSLAEFSTNKLEKILYPIGTYQRKASIIKNVAEQLLMNWKGVVPRCEKNLLSIKGIGRKTANLVRATAFDIPALCVDVHVHRISNKLGLVNTKTPHETEKRLSFIIDRSQWNIINTLFVTWGQNCCKPEPCNCFSKNISSKTLIQAHCRKQCPLEGLCTLLYKKT